MKITISNKFSKKSHRAFNKTPSVCFDMSWETIAMAIQEYRLKHGYAIGLLGNESGIESVHITKDGITFNKNLEKQTDCRVNSL